MLSFMNQKVDGRKGFSLLELMVVLVLVFTLSAIALPLSKTIAKRSKEGELKQKLLLIRRAIDNFHRDWNREGDQLIGELCRKNKITCKEVSSVYGYPKTLEALLNVELSGEVESIRLKYLRQIWTDPITGTKEWGLRCYTDEPDAMTWCGDDVYDVYTTGSGTAMDGSQYHEW